MTQQSLALLCFATSTPVNGAILNEYCGMFGNVLPGEIKSGESSQKYPKLNECKLSFRLRSRESPTAYQNDSLGTEIIFSYLEIQEPDGPSAVGKETKKDGIA
jgi:hypothetical protein